jgi:hypothetical protein
MLCSYNNILISREIHDVYQFIALDFFDNYPKWSPEVYELEKLTSGDMRVGITGRQVRYDSGYRSEAHFRVTRLDPLRELRFVSMSKPYFEVRYLFEPFASGTRLIFDFQLELPLFMLPLRNRVAASIKSGGERIVCNLKKILETNADASTRDVNDTVARMGGTSHGSASD